MVLLSHRGPVSFGRDESGRTAARGAGGLVTALTGLVTDLPDAVWVCAATSEEDAAVAAEHGGKAVESPSTPNRGSATRTEPAPPMTRRPCACAWSRSSSRPTTTSTR